MKRIVYREPGYEKPRLPLGTRVYVETQGLVPQADFRCGRVLEYDEGGNVQVMLEKKGKQLEESVWLYPNDVREIAQ